MGAVAPTCGMGTVATCGFGADRNCASCASCAAYCSESGKWPFPDAFTSPASTHLEPLVDFAGRSFFFSEPSMPSTAHGEATRDSGGGGAGQPASSRLPDEPQPSPASCLAESRDGGPAGGAAEVVLSRQLVEIFVRGLVKGIKVAVVSTSGDLVDCILSVDRNITTLSLQRANKKDGKRREIPMRQVHKICTGSNMDDDVELFMDDLCVTLLLKDGQMVSFSFEDRHDRNIFARCLSAFVDGHQGRGGQRQRLAPGQEAAAGRLQSRGGDLGLEDPDTLSRPMCQESPAPYLPQLVA